MSKGKHKDNLEHYFKKSFEGLGDSPFEDGWDVPSDGVWTGISGGMKGAKSGFWNLQNWKLWAMLALLLSAIIIYQFYSYQNNFDELNEQVLQNVAMIEDLKEELKEEQKNNIATSTQEIQKTDNQPNENDIVDQIESSDILVTSKNGVAKSSKLNAPRVSNQGIQSGSQNASTQNDSKKSELFNLIQPEEIEQQGIDNPLIAETIEMSSEKTPFSTLSSVSSPNSFVHSSNTLQLKLNKPKIVNAPIKSSDFRKWSVQPYLSTLFSNRVLRNKETGNVRDFGLTNSSEFSYAIGADINLHFNKNWSVFSGLNYQNLNLSSTHRVGFRYSEVDAAINDKGNPERDYDVDMSTEYGDINFEVRAENEQQHDGFDYSEGRPIRANVTVAQQLQYMSIPVGLKYQFNAGKWSVALKGAVMPSFLMADDINITKIKFVEDRLVARDAHLKANKVSKLLNPFVLNAQAGLGIAYEISPKLKIALEPTLQANLTPYMEKPKREVRTYSVELRAGLAYQF